MESSEHYLTPFLSKTLPELGLGYTNTEDAVEENEDALDEVIQLLRASSETHSDINEPWTQLKNDIILRRNEYMEMKRIEKEQEILTRHSLRVESSNIDNGNPSISETSSRIKEATEMDEMKRALVEKYAYDESVLFDEQGNEITNHSDEEEEKFLSNRQIAQQQHLEKMQELRTANCTSKKDEREKTKLAKLEKNKQKEDRRLRAQKGERRS